MVEPSTRRSLLVIGTLSFARKQEFSAAAWLFASQLLVENSLCLLVHLLATRSMLPTCRNLEGTRRRERAEGVSPARQRPCTWPRPDAELTANSNS